MAGSWVAHQVNSRAFASTSCTDGSNPSLSATQSEVQRNLLGLLLKLREMGAIPHLLRSNRTGESVLPNPAGRLSHLFLWEASEQSAFKGLHQANALRSQTDDVAGRVAVSSSGMGPSGTTNTVVSLPRRFGQSSSPALCNPGPRSKSQRLHCAHRF